MSTNDIRLESVENVRRQNVECRSERNRPRKSGLCRCICSRICISLVIAGIIAIVIVCVGFLVSYEKDSEVIRVIEVHKEKIPPEQEIWYNRGLTDLKEALNKPYNWKRARNILLFVVNSKSTDDFMRHTTGESSRLWKKLPHMGLLKIQSNISLGTALFGGVKGPLGTAGVDSAVPFADCAASLNETHRVKSIVQLAQEIGLSTGVVSTGDLLDAVSSPIYAHVANVNWHCRSKLPQGESTANCLDVATQLASTAPGKDINVLMTTQDSTLCKDDPRILKDISDLYTIPQTASNVHLTFSSNSAPSFRNLTHAAIQKLSPDHFLLIALWKLQEDGNILDFEASLENAMTLLRDELSETLIIVTVVPHQNIRNTNAQDKPPADASPAIQEVVVRATGPMAHLLQDVHDLTYVAHVISFAARLGRFRDTMLANSLFEWF